MAKRNDADDAILVIGLGRFGSAIAVTLDDLGKNVLAVESNTSRAQNWSHRFRVVQADASSPEALDQIGAHAFNIAVVGVGTSLEASVLITANLVDAGVPEIWAKATSRKHGTILKRIGANHVVYPENDAGQRVAHMLSGKMLDYIEMEDQFTIVKMIPPKELVGFTLAQSNVTQKYGIRIIGVKSPGQPFEYANRDTKIGQGDVIIVSGDPNLLEQFANHS